MSVLAAALRELIAAGLSGEQLIAAMGRIEEAYTPKETAGAIRTRRWRHKASQSVTSVTVTPSPPKEIPPTPPKEITPSSSLREDIYITGQPKNWPTDYREQFWARYPRKVEKKAALAALDRVRAAGRVSWETLIGAVARYAKSADPKFTKHPTTWLNKGCWDDDPESKPEQTQVTIQGFYAAFNSQQLEAWNRYERKTKTSSPRDKNGGWRFPTEWPPSDEMRLMAREIDSSGGVNGRNDGIPAGPFMGAIGGSMRVSGGDGNCDHGGGRINGNGPVSEPEFSFDTTSTGEPFS